MGVLRDFIDRAEEEAENAVEATGDFISGVGRDVEREVSNAVDYLGNFGGAPGDPVEIDPAKVEKRFDREAQNLLAEIQADESISDITREELVTQVREDILDVDLSSSGFGDVQNILDDTRSTLEAARKGDADKFRSRQATESRFESLRDQPARQQLFLSEGMRSTGRNILGV